MRRITALVGVIAVMGSALFASSPAAHAAKLHHPDFDGDGYADLVVTAHGDDVNGADRAGGFWVLYGGVHGANTGNAHHYFTEASIGRGASSAAGDHFGSSYTTGDFNGDGYDDVAVGADSKTIGGHAHAGAVVVLYGSPFGGLARSNAQFFTEATSGMQAAPDDEEFFGHALAAGDFNHDGRDDLAIGAEGEDIGGEHSAGIVFELFGTASGLSHASPLAPRHFHELLPDLHGGANSEDRFGRSLQVGDFDGDRFVDLAVGAPHKRINGHGFAGALHVLRGSSSGLTTKGGQTWTQDTSGVPDSSEDSDTWASTLAALDVNGDGRSDLVVGAPNESQGATDSIGAATLLMGGAHGLTATGAAFYVLSNTTAGETQTLNDFFGSSFAPFDFDGDGRQDLAIGVDAREIGATNLAGEVVVLHNVGGRLSRSGGFTLSRATAGMTGPPVSGQYFGSRVRGGDWSGNGFDDLAVSLPFMDVSGQSSAGAMQVFYGTKSGLATNDQQFTANTLGATPYDNAVLGGYDS